MRTRRHFLMFAIAASLLAPPAARAQALPYLSSWGSYGFLPGQFNSPTGIALGAGDTVYVINFGLSRIDRYTTQGTFIGRWPHFTDGLSSPSKIAVAPSGSAYVLDTGKLLEYDPSGTFVTFTYGGPGQFFNNPSAVAVGPDDRIYVCDRGNSRIEVFSPGCSFVTTFGTTGGGPGEFDLPQEVTVGPDGTVFVTDTYNHRIEAFTGDGLFLRAWGTQGSAPGQFDYPVAVTVDAQGLVYVADYGNRRIQAFDPTGTFLAQFGSGGSGPGQFARTVGMDFDSAGRLYVLDFDNNRVDVFGDASTPVHAASWGAIKARYR